MTDDNYDRDYAIRRAQEDYIEGRIEADELEAHVGRILNGTDRHYTSPFESFETVLAPNERRRLRRDLRKLYSGPSAFARPIVLDPRDPSQPEVH